MGAELAPDLLSPHPPGGLHCKLTPRSHHENSASVTGYALGTGRIFVIPDWALEGVVFTYTFSCYLSGLSFFFTIMWLGEQCGGTRT